MPRIILYFRSLCSRIVDSAITDGRYTLQEVDGSSFANGSCQHLISRQCRTDVKQRPQRSFNCFNVEERMAFEAKVIFILKQQVKLKSIKINRSYLFCTSELVSSRLKLWRLLQLNILIWLAHNLKDSNISMATEPWIVGYRTMACYTKCSLPQLRTIWWCHQIQPEQHQSQSILHCQQWNIWRLHWNVSTTWDKKRQGDADVTIRKKRWTWIWSYC